VKRLHRKTRFWLGFLFVVFIYSLPISGFAFAGLIYPLAFILVAFAISVCLVYKITIKNRNLKYPLLSPEGHPDVYTGRMPRPIHEDMQLYPWFFKKKHARLDEDKKTKKKH